MPSANKTHSVSLRAQSANIKEELDKKNKHTIDPITFSVILNRFRTIADEMTLTMEKTAWSSVIALARDFSCAIYDSRMNKLFLFRDRLGIKPLYYAFKDIGHMNLVYIERQSGRKTEVCLYMHETTF